MELKLGRSHGRRAETRTFASDSSESAHLPPGHIPTGHSPLPDNSLIFTRCGTFPFHHHHPPIYKIKRSTVNVYKIDSGRSARVRSTVGASFKKKFPTAWVD